MAEITNKDGNRNWEANILFDNIKRLEQENAELKHTLDCKNGTIETLKAENDRLKEENKELNKMTGIFSARLCEKYRTTLQEIKAIAEKLMADNLCNNCDGIGLDANCQDTGCPYYQMDKILQKITKAEEE